MNPSIDLDIDLDKERLGHLDHELRTPIHAIQGMIDLLLATPLDPLQRDYLDTIRGCADLVVGTVGRLIGAPWPASTPPPDPQRDLPPLQGRILLAEDNAVNQKLALAFLDRLGCRADVVCTGAEVLSALQCLCYDALLLDCEMPVLDGLATARELRRREAPGGRRLPIIALTARAMPGDRERCLQAGMDAYLAKPLRLADLHRALRRFLVPSAPPEGPPIHAPALDDLRALSSPGGPDLARDIIHQFLGDLPARRLALRADAEPRVLAHAAHELKSSSAVIGALRLSRLCGDIEAQCQVGAAGAAPDLPAQLQIIERECDLVRQALLRALATLEP